MGAENKICRPYHPCRYRHNGGICGSVWFVRKGKRTVCFLCGKQEPRQMLEQLRRIVNKLPLAIGKRVRTQMRRAYATSC